jgi:hypothetical protein
MTEKIPARLAEHPTVRKVRSRKTEKPGVIDAEWLRQVCLDAGADDVAFANIDNPDLASEREHVDAALPGIQSYISLVVKMNRDNVRSTARSVANQEFHRSGEIMNASMWQSLSFKANYKAAYCLAVCPAGEEVIEPYFDDRKGFMDLVLKPLQEKKETLYVLSNSPAKAHAERRYPHKRVKVVDSGISGR